MTTALEALRGDTFAALHLDSHLDADLWLEMGENGITLNDCSTAVTVDPDEDVQAMVVGWLEATS